MKRLLLIVGLICMMPLASYATPISQQTANTYYKSCMDRADERITLEGQESLCSCASVKLMSAMTLEELAGMTPAQGPGRVAYNKMLSQVYGPCLQTAIEDELQDECMQDKKIEQFMLRNRDKMCQCVGTRTGDYLEKISTKLVEGILRQAPTVTDIYQSLLNNQDMRKQAYDNVYTCMYEANP